MKNRILRIVKIEDNCDTMYEIQELRTGFFGKKYWGHPWKISDNFPCRFFSEESANKYYDFLKNGVTTTVIKCDPF